MDGEDFRFVWLEAGLVCNDVWFVWEDYHVVVEVVGFVLRDEVWLLGEYVGWNGWISGWLQMMLGWMLSILGRSKRSPAEWV